MDQKLWWSLSAESRQAIQAQARRRREAEKLAKKLAMPKKLEPMISGVSYPAYIRAELPQPEPWHRWTPPWEDPPEGVVST